MAFLIALFFSFSFVPAAHAAYSNDSSSIDIQYSGGGPVFEEPDEGGDTSPDDSSGDETPGDDTGGQSNEGGSSGGGVENSSEVTVNVTVVTTPENSGGNSNGGGSENPAGILGAEDILGTLTGNQALFSEGSASSGAGDGSSAFGAADWGSIRISGAKARAALAARGITALDISAFTNRFRTRGDAQIALASKILENTSIEDVVLSLNAFTISYKAQGRLFAVFPMEYTIRLNVNPHGATPEERVSVGFPWYGFFLTKYQSKAVLQKEIDAVVVATLEKKAGEESAVDSTTSVFAAVADRIKERLDTVSGSL